MPLRRYLLARTRLVLLVLLPALVCGGCTERPSDAPPVVDLLAEEREFTAPDSVASGWVTFRMHNLGSETHCMEIDRLPEDVTLQEYRGTVERLEALRDSLVPLLSRGAIDTAEAVSELQAAAPDSYWGGTLTGPGSSEPERPVET